MMMKRKSRSSREAMERTEFSRDATRLDREFQYLQEKPVKAGEHVWGDPVHLIYYADVFLPCYFEDSQQAHTT